MEEISKKDLLILTGISYGQLYRWKRKGLIPEEWFIKRASFTGQETYFPKDLILERIDKILELKDDVSLEELSEIINNKKIKKITISDLQLADIFFNQEVLKFTNNNEISFNEVICLKIVDNIYHEVKNSHIKSFFNFLLENINDIITNYKLIYISTKNDTITSIFTKDNKTLTYNFNDYIKLNLNNLIDNIKLIILV